MPLPYARPYYKHFWWLRSAPIGSYDFSARGNQRPVFISPAGQPGRDRAQRGRDYGVPPKERS